MKDKLFELIKSLDKNEKRYIRLSLTQELGRTNKLSLLLFDRMDKQKLYNEPRLKKELVQEAGAAQYSRTKSYLYDLILKIMRNYTEESSRENQLRGMLNDIWFLFHKNLKKQCDDLIQKAKAFAVKYEYHTMLLEILTWEFKLTDDLREYDRLDETRQLRDIAIKSVEERTQYLDFLSQLSHLAYTTTGVHNKAELKRLDNIKEHPIIKHPEKLHSKHAHYYRHAVLSGQSKALFLRDEQIQNRELAVEVMDKNPDLIQSFPMEYTRSIALLVSSYYDTKDFIKLRSAINKLRSLKDRSRLLRTNNQIVRAFVYSFGIESQIFHHNLDRERSFKIYEEIIDFIKRNPGKITKSYLKYIYYNIASGYLVYNDLSNALKWCNRLLQIEGGERKDIDNFGRLLNIVIHIEMGNMELLESILRSTERNYRRRKIPSAFETEVLNFGKELIKQRSENEREQLYAKTHALFTKMRAQKKDLRFFNSVDMLSWLKGKMEGKSLHQVLDENKDLEEYEAFKKAWP